MNKLRVTLLLAALVGICALRACLFAVRIEGRSMEPTYHSGDYVIMRRSWRRTPAPKRFEIVTVKTGSELLTKRVIALPGELLWMDEGVIFINGKRLEEPFPVKRGLWTVKPGLIETGRFVLIGDNREAAEHSFFVVPRENIIARVF
jgi:signal peptidase I